MCEHDVVQSDEEPEFDDVDDDDEDDADDDDDSVAQAAEELTPLPRRRTTRGSRADLRELSSSDAEDVAFASDSIMSSSDPQLSSSSDDENSSSTLTGADADGLQCVGCFAAVLRPAVVRVTEVVLDKFVWWWALAVRCCAELRDQLAE
jgi:hypothetical protein